MGNSVRTVLSADDKTSGVLDKVRDKFNLLGKSAAGQGIIIGAASGLMQSAIGGVGGAIDKVVGFLGDSVSAYRNQEVAASRLTASLKANVAGWDGNTDAINKANLAGQALGFDNTDITNSMAQLVGATHNVNDALKVQSVAMDLARFKGISLADASDALTKVEGGSYRILKSLGIELAKGATQTQALAAVEKVAGGQAQAYAKTDLGAVDIASAKVQDAQEKLGASLSHVGAVVLPVLADALGAVASGFDLLDTAMGASTQTSGQFAQNGMQVVGAGKAMHVEIANVTTAVDQLSVHTGKLADDASVAFNDYKSAATSVFPTLDDLKKKLSDAASASSSLDGYIKDLADSLFGITSKKGEVAQAAQDLADLVKAGPTSKDANDVAIWNGKVADAKAKYLELSGQLALAEGPAAFSAWLDTLQTKLGLTNAQVSDLITLIKGSAQAAGYALDLLTGYGGKKTTGSTAHRAGGGPVDSNTLYLVGEKGPELFVPRSAGTILPSGVMPGVSATASKPSEIHYHYDLTVQGNLVAETREQVLDVLRRMTTIAQAGAKATGLAAAS